MSILSKGARPPRVRFELVDWRIVPCASGDGPTTKVALENGRIPAAWAIARSASAPATSARRIATSSVRSAASGIAVGRSNGPHGAGAAAIATAKSGIIAPGKTGRLRPRSIYLGERANSKYVLETARLSAPWKPIIFIHLLLRWC